MVTGMETASACDGVSLGSFSKTSGTSPTPTRGLFRSGPEGVATTSGRVVQPSTRAGGRTSTCFTPPRLTPSMDTAAGLPAGTPRGNQPVTYGRGPALSL